MSRVKENLIAAKALIDTPEKWHKGSMRGAGCFCAMGAVCAVTRDAGHSGWTRDTAEFKALKRALPDAWHDVPIFNDAPATTHIEVMALFGRAIAALEDKP